MKKVLLILLSLIFINQLQPQITSLSFDPAWSAQFQAALIILSPI